MAAAADELSKNIRDQFLQCKICLDNLKSPKTLPCLHTFCSDCIIFYVESNAIDSRKFACPMCRRHIYIPKNGIDGFPDSFFVESLNDCLVQTGNNSRVNECGICKFKESSVTATATCVECKVELCEECATSHNSAKVTKTHTLLPLPQAGSSLTTRENFCRIHRGENIKYYCETCNSPICLPCTFLEHKGHEIEEISGVRAKFTEDMSTLVVQSEDNMIQLESARDDLTELENELFLRKEAVKTDIRRMIQDMMRTVNQQESKLITEVDTFYDTVSLGRDRQKIERTIFRLQRTHDFAKQLLSSETSPIAQLVNRNEAKDNLTQALSYELPDIMVHASKLDSYVYFLPGHLQLELGSILRCSGQQKGAVVAEVRHTMPTSKAMFLHKLKTPDGTGLGDILSVAFLPSGDIVVLVSQAKKVRVFDNKGKLKYEFGDDEELQHPSDLCITRDGEIAVADCGHLCVKLFDHFGMSRGQFGSADVFGLPIALTMDNLGRYLVCDQAKERITIHRQHGELLHEVSIQNIQHPQHISCLNDKIFICDTDSNFISMYAYNKDAPQFIAKMSPSGIGRGEFLDCSGISGDNKGNLYISDNILDRIHVLNSRGEVSSLLACGKTMLRPGCLAVSSSGIMAVAQQGVVLDPDIPTKFEVHVYRVVQSDL